MQQQYGRRVLGPRLAVEDVDTVDFGGAVVNDGNGGLRRLRMASWFSPVA